VRLIEKLKSLSDDAVAVKCDFVMVKRENMGQESGIIA
jgi:hypothetical protein